MGGWWRFLRVWINGLDFLFVKNIVKILMASASEKPRFITGFRLFKPIQEKISLFYQ